ncbi:hypothetical protein EDEG_03257 [Edhazardia aedis USNM 41457]|uniref:ABC-2 type transporter domain-containing protein n=1 Tax=Edhazardia aedis (strain USNM 41457) TaxID=1003232 RepID=J9DLQ5_EDHAE|nr:hypothetical protein EDEG_03257 [Edhazardia aedis USNM 41457]|eukprot:EJW02307.1 hypothetical protein EDEG_03257 [Edhazardia aedis USNM 41457]
MQESKMEIIEKASGKPQFLDFKMVYKLFARGIGKLQKTSKMKTFLVIYLIIQILMAIYNKKSMSGYAFEGGKVIFWNNLHIIIFISTILSSFSIDYLLNQLESSTVLMEIMENSYTSITLFIYKVLLLIFYNTIFSLLSLSICFFMCMHISLLYLLINMIPSNAIIVSLLIVSFNSTFGVSFLGRLIEMFFIVIVQFCILGLSPIGFECLSYLNIPNIFHNFLVCSSLTLPIASNVIFSEALQLDLFVFAFKKDKNMQDSFNIWKDSMKDARLWLSNNIIPNELVFKSSLVSIPTWVVIGLVINSLRIKNQIKKMAEKT